MINITINIESICTGGRKEGGSTPIAPFVDFLNQMAGAIHKIKARLEDFEDEDSPGEPFPDEPKIDAEFIEPEVDGEPEKE